MKEAIKALLFFRKYDNGMTRKMQVAYGVIVWIGIASMMFSIYVLINSN